MDTCSQGKNSPSEALQTVGEEVKREILGLTLGDSENESLLDNMLRETLESRCHWAPKPATSKHHVP
jgi:hypothetical protein